MGIYGALSAAVTGLRAQSHALENISGNIANSQTTGYKRIETDFLDLIPDAPLSRQVPGAVMAQSRGTNEVQGDIKTVSNETFVALNSNGFFIVEPKIGQSDGNSVFAGTNFYTRRGDFQIDKDGMLVNGAGYYLKGLPIDPKTGNVSGSVPEVIKLSNSFLPAQQTTRINYQANLPQMPKTSAYNASTPNSELLNAGANGGAPAKRAGNAVSGPTDPAASNGFAAGTDMTFTSNTTPAQTFTVSFVAGPAGPGQVQVDGGATVEDVLASVQSLLRGSGKSAFASANVGLTGNAIEASLGNNRVNNLTISGSNTSGLNGTATRTAAVAPATISGADDVNFRAGSIAGGAITVFAENGAPAAVQMRWAKVDSAASGGEEVWALYYMSDSSATGGDTMWTRVNQDYKFASNGSLDPSFAATTITGLKVNGVTIGNVELRHETVGMTQFADVNGTVSAKVNQNGYSAGEFVSVAINDNGRVVATYSNGERMDMAQVVTAEFNAVNQLKRLDGGVFASTSESGEAIVDLSGGGIIGGALEASNTDISDEFTKLIVTQQAYAAGTRIVSAADKMLQEALNMIR
ncbi:hypothetical protein WH87_15765 [Devosia epidermidihirudinis]|uniref:Flagellar hook protein FlgE n=1 Tax=Devosia epidermidihirudinis TaxID=1293439 RepID=A0A0F5Q3Q2_9HYPH|nr:flagellar hook-basal body complex protein [Devosia epidermidihirudinis]KKC35520.1 hypothetical protein WH87_15765 [Devosia epidermidihirudinis]